MLKKVYVPEYIYSGIKHNDRCYPKRLTFFGADFETVDGEPYTLTVCDKKLNPDIIFVNRNNVLDKFLNYFEPRCLSKQVNIVYFHNLQFDISVLLIKYHKHFVGRNTLKIKYKDVYIEAVIGNITFARIMFDKNKKLFIYDSMAFIKGSLDNITKSLNLKVKKLERPKGLGEKKLKTKKFFDYIKTDAIAEYYLASWIIEQHRKYNIRICVSISQFASRVFRHYFLYKWERIKYPPKEVVEGSILSYHGGKNGFYLDSPTIVKNCVEIDINSAYPYAMTKLPNFVSGRYVKVNKLVDKYEGIYKISGRLKDCKYKIIFDHNFKEIVGDFKDIWTTSYELKEAIRSKEIEIKKIEGYVWVEGKASHNPLRNPLKEFVENFWIKKESAKTYEEKIMNKLILNSLYGKFIQTTRIETDYLLTDDEGRPIKENSNSEYKAGGLFNPFIATLITGFVRAYLHKLEHKYNSIHSSTDSIKTMDKINKLPEGLGGLKKEVEGKCVILRNKLYIHYDKNNNLKKYALHGFTGNINDLIKVVENKLNKYKIKRLLKVREAMRQKLKPLVMTELEKELDIDFSKLKII